MNENMETQITLFIGLTNGELKQFERTSNQSMQDFFAEILEETENVINLKEHDIHVFYDDIDGSALVIQRKDILYIEMVKEENIDTRKKDYSWSIL